MRSPPRALAALAAAAAIAACGSEAPQPVQPAAESDPGPIHVHGLGVDPADGSLVIATHTGLFRAGPADSRARRVGDRLQDTMGFTVVGPNRFLGSGHPDGRDGLPPFLGLIESRDGGRTWRAVALQGEVDFHVLEASGRRIYGYGSDWETREPRFLTSGDGGRTWERLREPGPLISLAIAPDDARALTASTERGLFRSDDGGGSWTELEAPGAGLVVWIRDGLVLADVEGRIWRAADAAAGRWRPQGSIDGPPAAFDTGPGDELLIATHDGVVRTSADAGRSWTVRSRP